MLSNPEVTGRLLKWRFKLEEHDIHYRPRTSVKGQILADFIVERPEEDTIDTTIEDKKELPDPWILFTNGSSCINAGLRIAEKMGVQNLQANVPVGVCLWRRRISQRPKRGLPHCYSLLWLSESSKIHQDSDVDKHITAELPDPTNDAYGYKVISELIMHGPCGYANPNATCMKDGTICNRNFPKPYSNRTFVDKDGYVHYRRPDKYWQRRRNLKKPCIGRLTYIHPVVGDLFYQRMLLCHQKGCRSFLEIRTFDNILYPTNKEACEILGLLGGTCTESDTEDSATVEISHDLCITDSDTVLTELKNFICDDTTLQRPTKKGLPKKVIVCPKNETTDIINAQVLSLLDEPTCVYLSSDEATPHGDDGGDTKLLYANEYLNSLDFAGLPHHMLELKVGALIILMRNLNLAHGLFNDTRMIVTPLLSKVTEAQIITGTHVSEKVFLPRISLINRDLQIPFVFKRKQFPVKLSYAMTINKSQGQSLEK
nr:DNA helicase [Tanacetum cinerariifolium]